MGRQRIELRIAHFSTISAPTRLMPPSTHRGTTHCLFCSDGDLHHMESIGIEPISPVLASRQFHAR